MEFVVLVNENDDALGEMEKMQAHRLGVLHRAFSVFIFNDEGEMLLQQRAFSKYHSGGLWTNACCGHPRPDEEIKNAAQRRVGEELGISMILQHKKQFIYKAHLDSGLTEHELDHVFTGTFSGEFIFNPDEVHATKWINMDELKHQIAKEPEIFTVWFKIILQNFF